MYEEIKQWAQILNESEKEEKEYKEACEAFEAEVDEAMPIDDILKHGEQRKADYEREQAEQQAARNAQRIRSIWIKRFYDDPVKHEKFAELELEFMDGSKEPQEFPVTTDELDKTFKVLKQNLNRAAKGHPVADEDVFVSSIRVAFSDPRIKYFLGAAKTPDQKWWFKDEVKKIEKTGKFRKSSGSFDAADTADLAPDYKNYNSGNVRYKYDPSVIKHESDKIDETISFGKKYNHSDPSNNNLYPEYSFLTWGDFKSYIDKKLSDSDRFNIALICGSKDMAYGEEVVFVDVDKSANINNLPTLVVSVAGF